MQDGILTFSAREEFRAWLRENGETGGGVWLLFGKPGGPKTLGAGEALEEALCFGWIDGQMRSLGDAAYKKYFSRRRPGSKWSEKNKALAARLEERGLMTGAGREKIREAKENGQWDAPKPPPVTAEQVALLAALLAGREPACANFTAMSPSVKRAYAGGYFAAKTEEGRAARLAWMTDRLDKNLKPM